jgi:hypothetical protein
MCASPVPTTASKAHEAGNTKIWVALFLCMFGGLLSLVSLFDSVTGYFGLSLFVVGFGLWVSGFIELVFGFDVTGFLYQFRNDCSGLGHQLIVFVVGLGVFSVVWFALGWPADMVYNTFSSMYTFTGLSGTAVTFTRGVIRLLPTIMFFISIFGLWVSSNRREDSFF